MGQTSKPFCGTAGLILEEPNDIFLSLDDFNLGLILGKSFLPPFVFLDLEKEAMAVKPVIGDSWQLHFIYVLDQPALWSSSSSKGLINSQKRAVLHSVDKENLIS